MKNINSKTALYNALSSVGINDASYRCDYICLEGDCYHIIVSTIMLKYEFYVDSATGEVLGINTEPEIDASETTSELTLSA